MWGAINNISSGLKDLTTKGLERAQVLLEKLDERLGDDEDDEDDEEDDNDDTVDNNDDNDDDQDLSAIELTGNESESELVLLQEIDKLRDQLLDRKSIIRDMKKIERKNTKVIKNYEKSLKEKDILISTINDSSESRLEEKEHDYLLVVEQLNSLKAKYSEVIDQYSKPISDNKSDDIDIMTKEYESLKLSYSQVIIEKDTLSSQLQNTIILLNETIETNKKLEILIEEKTVVLLDYQTKIDAVESNDNENKENKKQINDLKLALNAATQTVDLLRSENSNYIDTLSSYENKLSSYDSDATKLKAELEKSLTASSEMEAKLLESCERYKVEIIQLKESLASQSETYKLEISELKESLASQSETYNLQISELKESLSSQSETYNLQISELKESLAVQSNTTSTPLASPSPSTNDAEGSKTNTKLKKDLQKSKDKEKQLLKAIEDLQLQLNTKKEDDHKPLAQPTTPNQAQVSSLKLKLEEVKNMKKGLEADIKETLNAFSTEVGSAVSALMLTQTKNHESKEKTLKEVQEQKQQSEALLSEIDDWKVKHGESLKLISKLEEELDNLKASNDDKIKSLNVKNNDLSNSNNVLKNDVESSKTLLTKALAQCDDLDAQLARATAELEAQKKKIDESGSTAELVTLQKQEISKMTDDNNNLSQTLLSKENLISNLNSELTDLKNSYSSAVTKVKTLETQISQLEESLQVQTTQNSTLSISISQYLTKNNELEIKVKNNDEHIANYQNTIKSLTSERDTVLEEIQELQKNLSTNSDELIRLNKTLNENVNTNTKFHTANERNVQLERENEDLNTRLKVALDDLAKVDEKKKRDLENLKKVNEKIAAINRERSEAERQYQETINDLKNKLDDALDQNEDAHKSTLSIKEEELLQRIESLNKELLELTEKYNDVTNTNSTQANDIHRLEKTIENLNQQITTYEQEIQSSRSSVVPNNSDDISQLQSRLNVLEDEKKVALEQYQELTVSSSQQTAIHQKRIKALEDERNRLEREVENLEKSISDSLNNNTASNNDSNNDGWKVERRLFADDMDIEGGGVRVRNNNASNSFVADSEDIKKNAFGLQNITLKLISLLPESLKQKLPKTDPNVLFRMLPYYLIIIHIIVLYHLMY